MDRGYMDWKAYKVLELDGSAAAPLFYEHRLWGIMYLNDPSLLTETILIFLN